jgi:hypothetical protein
MSTNELPPLPAAGTTPPSSTPPQHAVPQPHVHQAGCAYPWQDCTCQQIEEKE